MFVGRAWLKARVQSRELFKSVSKELCELGLELSQLEKMQARLRLARYHCQRGVQLILTVPAELSVLPDSRGPSGDPWGPQLPGNDRKLMMKAGGLGRWLRG